jgi:hypothetical protein
MLLIFLDYISAFIGTIITFLGIIFIPEIRKNNTRLFCTILFAIITLTVGILKINSDNAKELASTNKIDHLDTIITKVNKRDSILQGKVDSNIVFLKRLEEIGVKDSANRPYVTNTELAKFKGKSIINPTNVESYYQKGGQTGRDFTNNYK